MKCCAYIMRYDWNIAKFTFRLTLLLVLCEYADDSNEF